MSCFHQWWVIRHSIAYGQESCCSLKISWYLVSKVCLFKPFNLKTEIFALLQSSVSLILHDSFFESGKRWSYDHIKSSSSVTWTWKVGFGNVISLKSSGGSEVLGFYICTRKVILLDGCLNWPGAPSGSPLAWRSSLPPQGLGLAGRPSSLAPLDRP